MIQFMPVTSGPSRFRSSICALFVLGSPLATRSVEAALLWSGISEGQVVRVPASTATAELLVTAVDSAGGQAQPTEFILEGNGSTLATLTAATAAAVRLGPLPPGRYFLSARTLSGPVAFGDVAFDVAIDSTRPPNDDWAGAAALVLGSSTAGSTVGATREPGEPDLGAGEAHGTIWWSWIAPESGTSTLTWNDGGSGARAGVFSGTSLSTLRRVDTGGSPDPEGQLTFQHVTGSRYFIGLEPQGTPGSVTVRLVGGRPPRLAIIDPPDGHVFQVPKPSALAQVNLRATLTEGLADSPFTLELVGSTGFRRVWNQFSSGAWGPVELPPGEYTWTLTAEGPQGLQGLAWAGFSILSRQPTIEFAEPDPWYPEELPLLLRAIPGSPVWLESSGNLKDWATDRYWPAFDGVQRVRTTNDAAFQFYRMRVE